MAGPRLYWPRGAEVEVHENEAMRLIAAGVAEPIVPGGSVGTWEMRISPKQYLERFPAGPQADRARALIGVS